MHPTTQEKQNSFDLTCLQDIDNEPLETELIRQLDNSVISMIQALYFEKHYDVEEMRKYFGGGLSDNYTDAFEQLSGLRHMGLQLHAWP